MNESFDYKIDDFKLQKIGAITFDVDNLKEVKINGNALCPDCNKLLCYVSLPNNSMLSVTNPLFYCPECHKYYEGELK